MFSFQKWVRRLHQSFRPVHTHRRDEQRPALTLTPLEDRVTPTHFRYGSLTWEPLTGNQVEFHIQQAWKLTVFPWSTWDNKSISTTTGPTVGTILNAGAFTYGVTDGSETVFLKVLSTDPTSDSFVGEAVRKVGGTPTAPTWEEGLVKNYTSTAARTAYFEGCCRISTLENNKDTNYRTETIVTPGGTNKSPVSSLAPVLALQDNQVATFQLTATDPNGDPIRYRLATAAEGGGAFEQPADKTINPNSVLTVSQTGLLSWDLRNSVAPGVAVGESWSVQVMVEDLTSTGTVKSKTPLDFIIRIIPPAAQNALPTIVTSPAGPFQVVSGQLLSFTVTASDTDGTIASLQATNPPEGMSLSTFTAGNPVTRTVTWTPTLAQATGDYTITFQATDNVGANKQIQVVITPIPANQAPTPHAGGPYTIAEGGTLNLSAALTTDPDAGDILSYAWDVNGDGTFTDVLGKTPSLSWLNLNTLGINDGFSTRNVQVRVDDGKGHIVTSSTVGLTINNAAPTLGINGPSMVNEGDTYFLTLSATDPGLDTIQKWVITWGDGMVETFTGNPSSATHVYADGPNTYTITATATDEDGTYATNSVGVAVNVDNVPPALTIAGLGTVDEGASFTLQLSVSDPGVDSVQYWDIFWGDSATAERVTGNPSSATHVYADGTNTYTITATATDEDGTYFSNAIAVAVEDVAPALTISGPADVDEGAVYTLTFAASDAGADTILFWMVNWGDGSALEQVQGTAALVTHTFADGEEDHTITATATNDDGTFAATVPVEVHVNNVARTVSVSGEEHGHEGEIYTLSLGSTDPGVDTVTQWIILWGDATVSYLPGSATMATHTYLDSHDHHIALQVLATDEDGTYSSGMFEIHVHNEDPTATLVAPDVNEGSPVVVSLINPTDPSPIDVDAGFEYAFDFGSGYGAFSSANSASFNPPTDGTYPVNVMIRDKDGGVTEYTTTVTVHNVAPTVDAGADQTVVEGSLVSLTGTFSAAITGAPATSVEGAAITLGSSVTDAGAADTHTYNWTVTKDGAAYDAGSANSFSFTPDDNGTYVVTLLFTDDDSGVATDTAVITVNNVAPTANAGADQTVGEGSLVSVMGTYTDLGTADTHTLTWSVVASNGQVITNGTGDTFSFTPNDNGIYTVTYTVTDDDGAAVSDEVSIDVTNVAPTAAITGAPATSVEGTGITLGSSITDAGVADTHTYSWTVTKDGVAYAAGSANSFSFTPNDNGTYVVTLVVTDDDTEMGSDTAVITVTNVAPTANAGADQMVNEGSLVSVTGTFSDPGADTHTLTWSVLASSGQSIANGSGAAYSFTPTDNGIYTVTFTVTDDDGGVGTDTAVITVNNVNPTAALTGPSLAVRGQPVSFAGSATDAGTADTQTLTWSVTRNTTVVATGTGAALNFVPTDTGVYTVTLTATDDDGGVGTATQTVAVGVMAIQADPLHPGQGMLVVGGSTQADLITVTRIGQSYLATVLTLGQGVSLTLGLFTPCSGGWDFEFTCGGVTVTSFVSSLSSAPARVVVYAQAGCDDVTISSGVSIPAWVYGGTGDDRLRGGGGSNVILGEAGDDLVVGGAGRDILIGGLGADRIVGNAADDIIIAGSTAYDLEPATLEWIRETWTGAGTYTARRTALLGTLRTDAGVNGPATVFDDGAYDIVTGSSGQDWFFVQLENGNGLVRDTITDLSAAEFAQDIDFIVNGG